MPLQPTPAGSNAGVGAGAGAGAGAVIAPSACMYLLAQMFNILDDHWVRPP